MIRILGRPTSSNVQKVLWCATELNVEVTHEPEYGGPFGNTDTPEYLSMNPNGLVPVLIEGDFILWESNAIVRHLCARYGVDTLWPSDLKQRAIADQWMEWHTTRLSEVMFPAFYQLVRIPEAERDMTVVDRSVADAKPAFDIMNTTLEGRRFMTGDTLTMADITYGATVHRWLNLPVKRSAMPNVEAWYKLMLERPAFRKHVAIPLA